MAEALDPLERAGELERIDALLTDLVRGNGRVLAIEGAPGIGKTTLTQAARRRAEQHGLQVLRARASELEREFAFGIPRQWFSPLLMRADPAHRQRLMSGAARLAGPVLEDIESSTNLQGAMHGLLWFAAAAAESVPLLLIVDDAQWSDEASARLLDHLVPRLEGLPVALLIATRPPDDTASGRLIARVLADPATEMVRPGTLSPAAVGELIEVTLLEAPAAEFTAACHAATGGNPFLVTGLARALHAREVTPQADQVGEILEIQPDEIGRVLLARVSPAARALARALAILDEPSELGMVGELAGLAAAAAAEAASELARSGLIEDARPLSFVHAIIRSGVLAGMELQERSALHAAAAQALGAAGASAERVAIHLVETDPAGDGATVAILQAAASAARRRGAPEVAVRLLRRALAEPASGAAEGEVLAELAYAEHDLDLPEAIDHFWLASQRATDPVIAGNALLATTWAAGIRWDPPENFVEAIKEARSSTDPETALLFEASYITGQFLGVIDASDHEERIERLSQLQGETPGECAVLAVVARLAMDAGRPASVVAEFARRATGSRGAIDEQGANSTWLLHSTICLRQCELFDEAEQLVESAIDQARSIGSQTGYAIATANLSGLRLRRGDVARAEELARSALGAGGQRGWYRAGATTYLTEALLQRGNLEEADMEVTRTLAVLDVAPDGELPPFRPMTPLLIARGQLRYAQGRLEDARRDLEAGVARILRHSRAADRLDAIGLDARLSLVQIEHAAGEREAAAQRLDDALESVRHWGTDGAIGTALRVKGRLTGGRAGIAILRDALDHLRRSPFGLEYAWGLLHLGEALRRSGARAEAREPLREAHRLATAGGATVLAETARVELAQTGVRVRRDDHRDRLTPSEQRIAELAASGQTNPQIAQALFITTKTVETHLANAYRKLDINSRRELPRVLAERGALPGAA